MNVWALQRKIITWSIFVAIIISSFFIIKVFFSNPEPPSCRDNIQNQGEFGVDCGRVCGRGCVYSDGSSIIKFVRVFPASNDKYIVAAQLFSQQKGTAFDVPYEISFFNSRKEKVGRVLGDVSIRGGETTPILLTQIDLGKSIVKSAQMIFLSPPTWYEDTRKAPSIFISGEKLITDPPSAEGAVENNSADTLEAVEVLAYVRDLNNTVIDASKTFIPFLGPNQKQNVFYTWNRPFSLNSEICTQNVKTHIIISGDDDAGLELFLSSINVEDKVFLSKMESNERVYRTAGALVTYDFVQNPFSDFPDEEANSVVIFAKGASRGFIERAVNVAKDAGISSVIVSDSHIIYNDREEERSKESADRWRIAQTVDMCGVEASFVELIPYTRPLKPNYVR